MISLNWVKDYIDLTGMDLKELAVKVTKAGINVEKVISNHMDNLIIGEVVSGIIHNNLRLQNNMDMMESFKLISELISSMIAVLSDYFDEVHIYVTEGNHSRISPNKEDSLKGENSFETTACCRTY